MPSDEVLIFSPGNGYIQNLSPKVTYTPVKESAKVLSRGYAEIVQRRFLEGECSLVDVENIGTIATLNMTGDSKYTWNRDNPKECQAAHEHFDAMKAKGFMVFKVKKFGRKGEITKDFDPRDGGYIYKDAEIAREFEPTADYVVTPKVSGG